MIRAHMHAGSLYCDGDLLKAGMHGESVRSGAVLVVKTHRTYGNWTEMDRVAPRYESKEVYTVTLSSKFNDKIEMRILYNQSILHDYSSSHIESILYKSASEIRSL